MSFVVLDHIRGLGISVKDVLCFYTLKMSHIPYKWYLFHHPGMSGFITRALSTNKDLDYSLVAVLRNGSLVSQSLKVFPRF